MVWRVGLWAQQCTQSWAGVIGYSQTMSNLRDQLAKHLGMSRQQAEAKAAEDNQSARRDAEQKSATEHGRAAPRYLDAELLSLDDARKILTNAPQRPATLEIEGEFDPELYLLPSVQHIDHDVVVDDLRLPAEGSNLIIEGNLTVKGILKQDFRAGALLVMGDLQAGHVLTTGELACAGELRVDGLLYGNCTNYGTNVWGKTTAPTVISAKHHYFSFWGGHDIGVLIDVEGDTPNLDARNYDGATMAEVVLPEFEDGFDDMAVFELVQHHGTVLKTS